MANSKRILKCLVLCITILMFGMCKTPQLVVLYLVVDDNYKGNLTLYSNCNKGEFVKSKRGMALIIVHDSVVNIQNNLDNVQVGILDEGDFGKKDSLIQHVISINPRITHLEKDTISGECRQVFKFVLDTKKK